MTDGGLTAGDLLRRVAAELGALAGMAADVQRAALHIAYRQAQEPGAAAPVIVELQALDMLTQLLTDLRALAEHAARQGFAAHPLDENCVRDALRLDSLADRLLGRDGGSDAALEGDFLL